MARRTCIEVLRENQNTGANKVGKPVTNGAENVYRGAEGKPKHGCKQGGKTKTWVLTRWENQNMGANKVGPPEHGC